MSYEHYHCERCEDANEAEHEPTYEERVALYPPAKKLFLGMIHSADSTLSELKDKQFETLCEGLKRMGPNHHICIAVYDAVKAGYPQELEAVESQMRETQELRDELYARWKDHYGDDEN